MTAERAGRFSSDRPLVTIVTPCYNSEAYIEETILSVEGQTYPNIEYIVVDGGSTDGTLDIVRRHEGGITRWVSEPDDGQADALGKGFAMARGEVFAWINADDVYPHDAVGAAVDALARGGADVVYGNRALIDGGGLSVGVRRLTPFLPYFSRMGVLYGGFGIYQPAAFWTRDIQLRVGGIDTSFQFCVDTDLVTRFVRSGARFRFLRRDLVKFRVHAGSKTATMQHVGRAERARIARGLPHRSPVYTAVIRLACRAWKVLYHVANGRVRYLAGRAFDTEYRFVP